MRITRRSAIAAVVAPAILMAGLLLPTVSADASQPGAPGPTATLPSKVPSANTPNIDDGEVFSIAQVGSTMVVGGSFTSVAGQPRTKVVAFDATTGALSTTFAPSLNGNVNAILAGPTAGTVYLGGEFTTVNGVATSYLTLLDLSTGALVPTFKAYPNGYVNDLSLHGDRLFLAGFFKKISGAAHAGLGTVSTTTGTLDPFMNVQLSGQHNDSGSGATSTVGPRDVDVTSDGTTLVAVGNFKRADGIIRDQLVLVDLTGSAAAVRSSWNTTRFSPLCSRNSFPSYMRGVAFSPDGSYFTVTTTGGGYAGTLCDAASRFETSVVGTDVAPTWIADTGGDTLWGITATSSVIYIGGHQRWFNNPLGKDNPKAGAVGRAGLVALDPQTGRPFSWNPGRKPMGLAVFAMLATPDGIWIGSDTDYVGNFQYAKKKLAFFPYAGGTTIPANTVGSLPGSLYLAGDQSTGTSLRSAAFDGTTTAPTQAVTTAGTTPNYSQWRGAFYVAGRVWYFSTVDGFMYSRTFDGTTWGDAVKIDPYHDAYWDTVTTGVPTGTTVTFAGVVPSLYGSAALNITSMTYDQGKVYYTLKNDSRLYARWFTAESGIMDERVQTIASSVSFSTANGLIINNGSLYYNSLSDNQLRKVAFTGAAVTGSPTTVSSGIDLRNRGLFLFNPPPPNQAPTAAAANSCTDLRCGFDGSGSTDSDGTIASYAWTFGDGGTSTEASPTHLYAAPGTYEATLTVTDDDGASSPTNTISVTVTAPVSSVAFVGAGHSPGGNVKVFTASLPTDVADGDTAVLFLTKAPNAPVTGPTGGTSWTQVGSSTNNTLVTTVWTRPLTAADAGGTVRFDSTAYTRASVNVAVYRGLDAAAPITALTSAGDSGVSNHTSPPVTADSGDWVLSFFGSRSSSTRTWSVPSSETARDMSTDSGNPSMQGLIADHGAPVSAGTIAGVTAVTDANTDRSVMWSLALNAG